MRAFIVVLALVLATSSAFAGTQFQVEPTRVDLSARAPAGALQVINHGAAPLRVQIVVMKWRDDANGTAKLEPATEVMVRPSLLEIAPGKSRTIRVGTTLGAGEIEDSYRVFIEELPDRRSSTKGHIQMLTRVGVPVFVAPKAPSIKLDATFDAATARVIISNRGTQHTKLSKIELSASRNGVRRWSHALPGWYVLARSTRPFAMQLGSDTCAEGDHLALELVAEDGNVTPLPLGRCEQ